MKVYQTKDIKNIAIIGNSGSRKTTRRSYAFESGLIKRRGTMKAEIPSLIISL